MPRIGTMSTATGIDLGPSSCALVGARQGSTGADVTAVHAIDPAEWPVDGFRLADALRSIRRQHRFPRDARVIAWQLASPVTPDDPRCQSLLKPIVDAGFHVEAVLTPSEALARLAESRPRPHQGSVAWLSINVHGAAIVIMRGPELLFSRTLRWSYKASLPTVREQLLQRYTLVSHLAPELQQGIKLARANHATNVDTVITCGNLPELRSLTMPLIEEINLEVETLDSADGLASLGAVAQSKLSDMAPAIRLAAVAALFPVHRPKVFGMPLRFAAAMVLAMAVMGAYLMQMRTAASPPVEALPPTDPTPTAPSSGSGPEDVPVSVLGSGIPAPEPRVSRPLASAPRVNSILIDSGRRLAMFGGSIVGVGDALGPRVVARIDQHGVTLQEPSGAQIRVLLRSELPNTVRLGLFDTHGRSPSTRTYAVR